MAQADKAEPPKIVDVAKPQQTSPLASSRPILVTNRPVLANDPMMVSTASSPSTPQVAPSEAATPSRQAKTIAPLPANEQSNGAEATSSETPAGTGSEASKAASAPVSDAKPSPETEDADDEASAESRQESEYSALAKAEAEQEAVDKRRAELEGLIEKGTYAVPINAVKRKRSRHVAITLVVVGFLLLLAVADGLLDAGLVGVPGIPHTHFLHGR